MWCCLQLTEPPNYRCIFATQNAFPPVYFQSQELRATLHEQSTRNKTQVPIKIFWQVRQDAKLLVCCGRIRQDWKAVVSMTAGHLCLAAIKASIFLGRGHVGSVPLSPEVPWHFAESTLTLVATFSLLVVSLLSREAPPEQELWIYRDVFWAALYDLALELRVKGKSGYIAF